MSDTQKPCKKAPLLSWDYFLYDFGKFWAILPGLVWLRPKWMYENKAAKKRVRGSAILMFNHTGFTDPIMGQFTVWYRRQHYVAAKELFRGKWLNWLFHVFHCIEVDRENFNFQTFRDITQHLEDGKIVCIYPEGHINEDKSGALTAFKSGVVMMALRSGRPVIPIYVRKPARWYNRAVFVIGEPINLREKYGALPSMQVIEQISEDLKNKEAELCNLIGK